MPEFDGDPNEAEADLRRASDAMQEAEDNYDAAMEDLDALEDQDDVDDYDEHARRVNEADAEATRLKQLVDEAEDDLRRTIQQWTDAGYLED